MKQPVLQPLESRRLLAGISGTIFNDRNNNATYDTSVDLPLGGVTVYLDQNNNAAFDAGETSVTSGSMTSGNWGRYNFSGLGVGTYRVRIVVPSGYAQTAPSTGVQVINITNAALTTLNVNLGARDLAQTSRLAGVAWLDADGNGTRETATEPVLVDVRVWADLDLDGVRDAGEPTTLTASTTGRFTLDVPNPSFTTTYTVRAEPPAGLTQTTLAASGGAWVVTIDAGNVTAAQNQFGFRDVTPPSVAQAQYDVDSTPNRIVLNLSETSINTSWTVGFALAVKAVGSNTALPFTMTTNSAGILAYQYAGGPASLPDGLYTATLAGGTLRDAAGNVQNAPFTFDFHVLTGDANRDHTVDFSDLLILAQNYGLSGRTFSQGNFNYSAGGAVDFDDLLLLAQRYGTTLVSAPKPVATQTRSKTRFSDRQRLDF